MNNKKYILHVLYDNEILLKNSIKKILKIYNKNIINEIYSPYPIHGLEKLLKLKKSNLSFLSFIYGIIGFLISNIIIWYIMIFDWPQNIGGKPSFSWIKNYPSFIPVIFELTIFFSAHIMCITYLIQCNLFPGFKKKNPDSRTTDDMFLIEILNTNNIENLTDFFNKNGAIEIHNKIKK